MNRPSFLRFCALLLLCILPLTSCGVVIWRGAPSDTESDTATTFPQTETDAPDTPADTDAPKQEPVSQASLWLDELPADDFGGIPVIVADLGQTAFVPSDTADTLSLAAYTRNRAVEKKYHTTILEVRTSSATALMEEAKASSKAGSYYADMLLLPTDSFASLLAADMLMNLNSLPFFNTNHPYFDSDAIAQFTVGGQTFALAGTLTEDPKTLYACFFNRKLLASFSDLSLYDAVDEGNWTLDTLLSLLSQLPEEVRGVTCYEDQDALLRALFLASGQHLAEAQEDGFPAPAFDGTRTDAFVSAMRTLFGDKKSYDSRSGSDALQAFYAGEDLFFIAPFYVSEWISDMNDSWGVVPLPHTDTAQTAYDSYASDGANLAVVLRETANVNRLSLFLQAIFAAAGDQHIAYLQHYTDICLRDSRSIDMLGRIIDGARYDLSSVLGSSYSAINNGTFRALSDAVYRNWKLNFNYGDRAERLRRQLELLFPSFGV